MSPLENVADHTLVTSSSSLGAAAATTRRTTLGTLSSSEIFTSKKYNSNKSRMTMTMQTNSTASIKRCPNGIVSSDWLGSSYPIGTTVESGRIDSSTTTTTSHPGIQLDRIDDRVCKFCQIRGKMVEDWKNGDRICTNCGIVDEEHILDTNPEWRDYDNDDRATQQQQYSTNARCGTIVNDETKYWGGLQPTTLSKYIFGGVSATRTSTGGCDSGAKLRKTVSMANYRIRHRIEQIQKRQLADAKLSYQIRKRQKKENGSNKKRRRRTDDDEGALGDDDMYEQHSYSYDSDDNDNNNTVDDDDALYDDEDTSRPELERLILQEEEDANKLQIALNSEKWSLERAMRLFGGKDGHHQHRSFDDIPDDDDDDNCFNERDGSMRTASLKSKKLDKPLRKASYELYTAYYMLQSAASALQLPSTVTDESVSMLCRYVQLRDGITVRGVATYGSSGPVANDVSNGIDTNTRPNRMRYSISKTADQRTKRELRIQQSQRERSQKRKSQALDNEENNDKQEEIEHQRRKASQKEYNHLKQSGALCSAILYLTSRVMKCPRTMEEVCDSIQLPDSFDKSSLQQDEAETGSFILRKHCSRAMNEIKEFFPDFTRTAASISRTIFVSDPTNDKTLNKPEFGSSITTLENYDSISNFIEHSLRKLTLPPVAQVAVRCLVYFCRNRSEQRQYTLKTEYFASTKLPTICASTAYFVCVVGNTMQRLASQAAADAAQEKQLKTNAEKKSLLGRSSTYDWKSKYSAIQASKRQPTSKPAPVFDVFAENDVTKVNAEQRAYEMRRMWDAWIEQMDWKRSLLDIEKATNVSQKVIRDYFKQHLFPIRQQLLLILSDSVLSTAKPCPLSTGDNTSSCDTGIGSIYPEQIELKETPLASLLLAQIAVATPLMKPDVKL